MNNDSVKLLEDGGMIHVFIFEHYRGRFILHHIDVY
jgi:hypothetical protein